MPAERDAERAEARRSEIARGLGAGGFFAISSRDLAELVADGLDTAPLVKRLHGHRRSAAEILPKRRASCRARARSPGADRVEVPFARPRSRRTAAVRGQAGPDRLGALSGALRSCRRVDGHPAVHQPLRRRRRERGRGPERPEPDPGFRSAHTRAPAHAALDRPRVYGSHSGHRGPPRRIGIRGAPSPCRARPLFSSALGRASLTARRLRRSSRRRGAGWSSRSCARCPRARGSGLPPCWRERSSPRSSVSTAGPLCARSSSCRFSRSSRC